MTIRAVIAGCCLLLVACDSVSDDDLAQRVEELEAENEALRAELEAAGRAAGTGAPTSVASPATGASAPAASVPATTLAPVTTTSVAAAAAGPGSRQTPIPVGQPVPAGDWVYTVVAFEPNADAFVAQMDANNAPAGEGKVYSRVRLRAEYRGQGAGEPRQLVVNLLTPSGITVGAADPCCEPTRDALTDQPATFNGGSVEGWMYYPVTATELFAGPMVAFDPNADQPNVPGGTVFFYVS